jgi:two-component system, LytTR family, response regulator
MIDTVIIDDESDAIGYLQAIIRQFCPGLHVTGTASTVYQGIDLIINKQPQLIFLDIQLPDGTGFDLLKRLEKRNFEVIFTSAYESHAINAFRVSALDYLMKPVDIIELKDAVIKAENAINNNEFTNYDALIDHATTKVPAKIAVSFSKGYEYIEIDKITRIEAERSYSIIHLISGKKILVSKSLSEFCKMLRDKPFFRVHNSHLINLEHVKFFVRSDGGYVEMVDGASVPLSRNKKDLFLQVMNQMAVN